MKLPAPYSGIARLPAERVPNRAGIRALSAVMIALACGATAASLAAQEVEKLGWLTGHWVQKTGNQEVQENWLGPRGNVMVATNLTYTTGRGSSFEFLRIAVKDGRIVYFASPGGRPAVEFPVKQMTEDSIAFENPANAYPQRIMYRREGEALVARIEGRRGGSDTSEEWRFVRTP